TGFLKCTFLRENAKNRAICGGRKSTGALVYQARINQGASPWKPARRLYFFYLILSSPGAWYRSSFRNSGPGPKFFANNMRFCTMCMFLVRITAIPGSSREPGVAQCFAGAYPYQTEIGAIRRRSSELNQVHLFEWFATRRPMEVNSYLGR